MSEYNVGGGAAAGGPTGPRASVGLRFVAVLIDGLILVVLQFLVLAVAGQAAARLVGLVAGIVYYTYFESQPAGQTIGKKVMNIRVIDFNTGGSLDTGKAGIRAVVRIVSGAVCLIGYIWALFNKENQTWHDLAAQTVVVPVSAYPVR